MDERGSELSGEDRAFIDNFSCHILHADDTVKQNSSLGGLHVISASSASFATALHSSPDLL